MPKLADLGLTNERVGEEIDYATIPDQMGTFQDPPQPGSFRFELPKDLSSIWETFDHTKSKNPGKRLRAKFDDSFPLTIVQSPLKKYDGLPFTTSLSNAERKRGKKDDATAPEVSDMDYLLRDAFGLERKPATNLEYAKELQKHAGEQFGADLEWSWRCNPERTIRVDNGQGGLAEVPNQKGCGTAYYQKDVQKVPVNPDDAQSEEIFPPRITCQCGAVLRAFANLTRYRR
jgi:hypothetical protein